MFKPTQTYFFVLCLCLCFFGFSFENPLIAQKKAFRTYSIEHGLSEAVVHDIVQTHDSFFWVATSFGLNKFDGISFQKFYTDDGLPSNKIHSLYEDNEGHLWVGTSQGVCLLDPDDEVFYTPDVLKPLDGLDIQAVFQDSNSEMWFATDGQGVWHLESQSHLIQYGVSHGLSNNKVRTIAQTKDGTLWFGTRNGLTELKNGNFRSYFTQNGLADNKIREITLDRQGNLLIATRGGLSRFDQRRFTNITRLNGLFNERVFSVKQSILGEIWLATEEGVYVLGQNGIRTYNTNNGLPVNIFNKVFIDHQGQIWLGSFGSGLVKYPGNFINNYDVDNGLPEKIVTDFVRDKNNNFWIATYGGGIALMNTGQATNIVNQIDGLSDDKVYTILEDGNKLWIGSQGGLDYLENGKVSNIDKLSLPFRKVRDIKKDSIYLWLATDGSGLVKFNTLTEEYTNFTAERNNLPGNIIEALEIDHQNRIWLASYSGVGVFDGKQSKSYTIEDGLPNNAITHLFMDQDTAIWACTYDGLARIKDDQIEAFTEAEGFPAKICHFITQDVNGYFWLGTNVGLIRFDYDAYKEGKDPYIIITSQQGLSSDEFNEGALNWDNDQLWVGTVNGASRINVYALGRSEYAPPVYLTKAEVLNTPLRETDRFKLSHNQNYLTFEYTGIDFYAPEQLSFAYRLRPIEDDFTYTDERSVKYNALQPGEYRFEVRAISNSGISSNQLARISFTIKSPFWKTWWFMAIIMVIMVSIIFFIYRYYKINQLVDIERVRVRIASDLHDDVGSTLTEIALQTDFLNALNNNPAITDELSNIGVMARKVVSGLDDIVWSIDARNDTAGDLGDRIQDYANNVFKNHTIKLVFDFDLANEELTLPVEVRENVYLICKEALNNAAKYSNANEVRVRISTQKGQLSLIVEDNGIGFKQHVNHRHGNGMLNMKMRAERIKAKLHIEDRDGTHIRVDGIKI